MAAVVALVLACQNSFEHRFMTRATEENEHCSHTCILFQFAHVPLVYSGILLDPSGSHFPTGNQALPVEQISGRILFLSSFLPRLQGSSQQLQKQMIE